MRCIVLTWVGCDEGVSESYLSKRTMVRDGGKRGFGVNLLGSWKTVEMEKGFHDWCESHIFCLELYRCRAFS